MKNRNTLSLAIRRELQCEPLPTLLSPPPRLPKSDYELLNKLLAPVFKDIEDRLRKEKMNAIMGW